MGYYDNLPSITEENRGLTAIHQLMREEDELFQAQENSYVGKTIRSNSSEYDVNSVIDPHANTIVVQEEETITSDVNRSGSHRSKWGRGSKRASIIGKDLEPSFDDDQDYDNDSHMNKNTTYNNEHTMHQPHSALSRKAGGGAGPEPFVSFDTNDMYRNGMTATHNDGNNAELEQVRKSLDFARTRLRNEQQPPRTSLDNIRMSMELDDMTTAEGLIRVLSNNRNNNNNGGAGPSKSLHRF